MNVLKFNLCGHDNPLLTLEGFKYLPIQADLADVNLEMKLVEFFIKQGVTSNSVVTIVQPGLAPLASSVLVVLHGLTGHFPKIQLVVRQEDGSYKLGTLKDMHDIRNKVARSKRPAMIAI